MSVKKIILELSHAHLFLHRVWTLLCYTDGKGSSCHGDRGARKGYCLLCRGCLPACGTDLEGTVLLWAGQALGQ